MNETPTPGRPGTALTRISRPLLGASALCLLSALIGLGISGLLLNSSDIDNLNAGRVGLIAAVALLVFGGLLLIGAFAVVGPSERRWLLPAFFRWTLVAAAMVIPTALLFGPTGGFHHHYGFGPTPFFYMIWNGEDPAPGSFQIVNGYEVWFVPWRFCVLWVVWTLIFWVAIRSIKPNQTRAA